MTMTEDGMPSMPLLKCENCSADNPETQKFCSACSFPINGSDQEKSSFRLILSSRKRFLADAEKKIENGKLTIYALAGLFFISGFFYFFVNDDVATLVVSLLIAVIYLGLVAWFPKNPFAAMLTAFVFYVTIQLVNAIADPVTIFSGWLIKIFVVVAFVKGIRSAREAQTLLKELAKLKGARGAE